MEKFREKFKAIFYDKYFNKIIMFILFILEAVLSIVIIYKVKYTEIDWIAYMQEVEGFLNGTLDYEKLGGQTGPLVYPAGFVYFYSVLYWITAKGENIMLGQVIFIMIYLVTLCLVFRIYHKMTHIPNYVLVFMCCTSYRIHSIYMLRLFNDPVAMLLLYAAVNGFLEDRYSLGSVIFSLAVSVKMNILLFAPGLLVIYLWNKGFWETVGHLSECAFIQVLLGMPFLIRSTPSYINRAFEFNRQFLFKWTVNWRFLPESIFLDRKFHLLLLIIHLTLLFVMLKKFLAAKKDATLKSKKIHNVSLVLLLFISNFIGVACSRSLHYQFYVWYYHSFPVILWSIPRLSSVTRLLIWGIIEMCWNTYPSTILSSGMLQLCHWFILFHWIRNNCFHFVNEEINDKKLKEH